MRIILVVLMALAAMPARGEWVKVTQTDGTAYYVDPATIRSDGSFRRAWQIQDYATPRSSGARSRRALFEFDCGGERWRVLSINDHVEPMAAGKLLGTWEGESAWSYVAPRTGTNIPPSATNRAILRFVCSQ